MTSDNIINCIVYSAVSVMVSRIDGLFYSSIDNG